MKKDNKGFSLVELIVVVAIMAVLMTVLAPQLLRYVEQSRLQNDNTTLSEVANAVEIAMANEDINQLVAGTAGGYTVADITGGALFTFDAAGDVMEQELALTVGSFTLNSNTYNGDNLIMTATVNANGTVTVSITNWMDNTTAAAANHTF